MYPNYMNKPTFMTNTSNSTFGASTSSFGQPSTNTSMFSSMQPSNLFQTPSTSSFNTGPSTQSGFAIKHDSPKRMRTQDSSPRFQSSIRYTGPNISSSYHNIPASGNPGPLVPQTIHCPPAPYTSSNVPVNLPAPDIGRRPDTPRPCSSVPNLQFFQHSCPAQVKPFTIPQTNRPTSLNRQLINYLDSIQSESTSESSNLQSHSRSVEHGTGPPAKKPSLQQWNPYGLIPVPGSNLFGQQPQPSTSSLFGSSNAFGQNKSTFGVGFGSTPSQTGLFGQQPQQQAGTSLFQPNTPNLFGGSSFGNQPTGTVIKFSPVTGTDTMQKSGVTQSISTKHHCITCMKEYEGKSLEELRFEDYSVNRKGPQQQSGFGNAPFGASTSGASTSLFGQTDNKQGFGQQGFGQPAFGQSTPAFGVANQANTSNLFGKTNTFGATTSTTPAFGFSATPSTSNPFSTTQQQKPFSQPLFGSTTTQAQPTFGSGVFGQTNTQNTGTNLFQKPAQPTTGFNTGQQGFSFNQPATTQSSALFQVSKPNTGFGIFGQSNTTTPAFGQTTQPTFGTNFGKLTQPTFSQPSQPTFGTNLTGLQQQQQQPLFGSTVNKPPSLFGNTTTGGSLFNNNVFQQTPNTTFSLNLNQPQTAQFSLESVDNTKNVSLIATDSFPDGPHIYGLDPVLSDSNKSTTNPKDLKALLDSTKEREDVIGTTAKIKVNLPKTKRGTNYNKEFFETSETLRTSHKCLVIRKFNENPTSVFNKYSNDLLEEAEKVIKSQSEVDSSIISPRSDLTDDCNEKITDLKGRHLDLKLQFSSTINDDFDIIDNTTNTYDESTTFSPLSSKASLIETKTSKSTGTLTTLLEEEQSVVTETDVEPASTASTNEVEKIDNPAGVILTRPEYYMYPALKDLHQYMDENGACIVQGLTIGRKGYGNVYYPDPIDITNMNLDEIIHFRYREIIVYPDENKKPPEGEGLNRRAQVTLDKIFPREKGTNNFIKDVNEIIQSNFVDNLMRVTQKHNATFVDYRPKTGSWVFKVKHFSKYGFTDSDDELCELAPNAQLLKKPQEHIEVEEEIHSFGLGGGPQSSKRRELKEIELHTAESIVDESLMLNGWADEDEHFEIPEEMFQTSAIQTLKSALFTNLDKITKTTKKETVIAKPKLKIPSEVIATPRIHKLHDISLLVIPEKITTQKCYTELGVFRCNTFKVGWGKGFNFYLSNPIAESEVIYGLDHCNIEIDKEVSDSMMPDLIKMFEVTLEESEFTFNDDVPTLRIKCDSSYLQKQADLFDNHVKKNNLKGREKYFCSVLNLCLALWGPGDDSFYHRRQSLSDWLKKYSFDLSNQMSIDEFSLEMDELKGFKAIYKLLSYYKVSEACELAMKHNLNRLSLLISQVCVNQRNKYWMQKFTDSFAWKEKDVIVDDFKKLFMLLAGIPVYKNINICNELDWMRCFGVHLWYVSPAAAPIYVAFNMYKKAFEEETATKPIPPYATNSDTSEYDLLYHILSLYVDNTYQLCKLLHPETHTRNVMDYRFSWFLMQLLLSLKVGLIRESEKEHLHTTFATQLENMGHWKWAIFTLLFLEDNVLKKKLINGILDRNLNDTVETERDLVKMFKIPPEWIHEVKAIKAKVAGQRYDYFQHCIYMKDYQNANDVFVEHILPELFVNGQYEHLMKFIKELESFSNLLLNWQSQVGLFKEFLDLQDSLDAIKEDKILIIGNKFNSLFRRINCFPVKNDLQKLCVAELCRKCALLFKIMYKNINGNVFQDKFVDVFNNLIMPPDFKHYEIYNLVFKYIQESQ